MLFPIVALALSAVFEGYRGHWTGFVGLAVTLAANLVIFWDGSLSPGRLSRRPRAAIRGRA